eukprot:782807-Amphidinium_carterae.1
MSAPVGSPLRPRCVRQLLDARALRHRQVSALPNAKHAPSHFLFLGLLTRVVFPTVEGVALRCSQAQYDTLVTFSVVMFVIAVFFILVVYFVNMLANSPWDGVKSIRATSDRKLRFIMNAWLLVGGTCVGP